MSLKNFYSEIYLVFVVSRYKVLFRGKNLSGDKSDCSMLLQEFDTEKQSFKLGNTKVNKLNFIVEEGKRLLKAKISR